jgi:DNA-binding transcriptional ArsR family regulator
MGRDDVFAVIAEGTRRHILESLRRGDKAVGELVVELQVSQPTVSKHLKVLREAGLVTMRAQGQKRFYSLETAPLDVVRAWLAELDDPDAVAVPVSAMVADAAALDVSLPAAVEDPGSSDAGSDQQREDVLAAAVLAAPETLTTIDAPRAPIGRTMGRAAERAADILAQLRRRRDS